MLKSTLAAMAAVFAISAFSPAMAAKGDPHVLLTTSAGNIELELNSQKAPISVDNFLKYVNSGFYNNTTFHRVIPGFMVQGGGFNEQMQQKQPNPPIKNEADNGLRNTRGTIAMAMVEEGVIRHVDEELTGGAILIGGTRHRDGAAGVAQPSRHPPG